MASLFSRLSGNQGAKPAVAPVKMVPVAEKERLAALLTGLEKADLGWFWESNAEGQLTHISPKAAAAIGVEPEALLGKDLADIMATDDTPGAGGTSRPLRFRMKSRSPISRLNVSVKLAEKEVWWEICAGPRVDAEGNFFGYHGTARDVTRSLAEAREAEHAAQFDSLTGLANRSRMNHLLDSTLASFMQSRRACAILLMDLDRFKKVNDTLGHPAGDELLIQVADRLKRICDGRGEIGRLGGDEFQIILPDMDDRGDLGDIAAKIVQMVSQP